MPRITELSSGVARIVPMLVVLLAFPALADKTTQTVTIIGGRVTDHVHKPVPRVQVNLRDNETGLAQSDTTDARGAFEFLQPRCSSCCLEVDPPDKTGLAMALIDYFPGDRTRQFSIHLQRGFAVNGKVTYQGKGLKGIFVQAEPSSKTNDEAVHGGGFTVTGGNGSFHLILTPGGKKLTLRNKRYRNLSAQLELPFNVTADTILPEITLPGG